MWSYNGEDEGEPSLYSVSSVNSLVGPEIRGSVSNPKWCNPVLGAVLGRVEHAAASGWLLRVGFCVLVSRLAYLFRPMQQQDDGGYATIEKKRRARRSHMGGRLNPRKTLHRKQNSPERNCMLAL